MTTSNIEVNGPAAIVVIVDQLLMYARKEHPGDGELIEMLTDMEDAAKRLLGWLRILQECRQHVKIMYSEYVAVHFKPKGKSK